MMFLFKYVFPTIPPGLNATEQILSDQMGQVWTNFVIYGYCNTFSLSFKTDLKNNAKNLYRLYKQSPYSGRRWFITRHLEMACVQRQYGILHGYRSQLGSESRLHTDLHSHCRRVEALKLRLAIRIFLLPMNKILE
jgi:hypothetical protein